MLSDGFLVALAADRWRHVCSAKTPSVFTNLIYGFIVLVWIQPDLISRNQGSSDPKIFCQSSATIHPQHQISLHCVRGDACRTSHID
ncbi:hypothetical protein TNCV_429781 [Trichonephila clavipes]|nr:hypothetical protein TNCV_429781 [Trichonephila clavipes]